MLPTSLPGGMPGGMTAARPTSPRAASRARVGMDATSSGVFPPSAATGRSAHPSGTHTTYFTRRVSQSTPVAQEPDVGASGGSTRGDPPGSPLVGEGSGSAGPEHTPFSAAA